MFFQAINRMITAGTDLSFSIRQVDNRLTVAVMPRRTGLKGEAGGQIVPLVLNGTPEELDAEFLQAISTPVQKAQGILTNLETFEKQAEQAASQNKGAKSPLEKEPKEVREKREKMEKLLKKADEAIAGKRYSEALTWLRQAKVLATPDRQKDIDAKMAEVQKKASEGSLFGEEPFMQASQPQQEAQPLRRQDGQALIFEPEPAISPAGFGAGTRPLPCLKTYRNSSLRNRYNIHSLPLRSNMEQTEDRLTLILMRNNGVRYLPDSPCRHRRPCRRPYSSISPYTCRSSPCTEDNGRNRSRRNRRMSPYRPHRETAGTASTGLNRSRRKCTALTRMTNVTGNSSGRTLMPNTLTFRKNTG